MKCIIILAFLISLSWGKPMKNNGIDSEDCAEMGNACYDSEKEEENKEEEEEKEMYKNFLALSAEEKEDLLNRKDIIYNNVDNYPELGPYVEGDIIISPTARNGIIDKDSHWPNGVVPIKISKDYNDREKRFLSRAMARIQKNTCVEFVKKQDHHDDYVFISPEDGSCSSNIGRIGGKQTLNLASKCFKKIGTSIHELMHTLGIKHEHARSDRDKYIKILKKNVKPEKMHNFDKTHKDEFTTFGLDYDYDSVMHYSKKSFSKNGKDTIKILGDSGDADIGQRDYLSDLDIEKINKLYNCNLDSQSNE